MPITLGTVFPVGFRAAEQSRVMRIEPHDYHSIAAAEPALVKARRSARGQPDERPGRAVRASPRSRRRRGRSSSAIAGTLRAPTCGASSTGTRSRFTWLQPDADDATEQWGGPLPPAEDRPTIRVVDGKTVVRPQLRRVAELLELDTEPDLAEYDTVIVGAGRPGWRRPCTAPQSVCGRS